MSAITDVSVSIDLLDHDDDQVAAEILVDWIRRGHDPVTVIVTHEDGSENAITLPAVTNSQPSKESN